MYDETTRISLKSSFDEMRLMCLENRKKYLEHMYMKFESLGMKTHIHILAGHHSVSKNQIIQDYVTPSGITVFNIASSAVVDLNITLEHISFTTRFNKVATHLIIPMDAIHSISNAEMSMIYGFPNISISAFVDNDQSATSVDSNKAESKGRPALRVVK